VRPLRNRHRLSACLGILLTLSLVLPGCWGRKEVEERSSIHILGVDKGTTQEVLVTAAIAVPRTLRQGPQGSPGGMTSLILDGEGYDILDALNRLETLSSREFTGQHITCIVLGEELARDDISPVMDVFHRSIEFRPTTLAVVCKGKARDFIRGLRAPEETDIADYLTKVLDTGYDSLGYCPIVTMHDLSERYQTSGASPWAPLLALAAPSAEEPGAAGGGEAQARDENKLMPATIAGTALFALEDGRYRMVGHLYAEETRAALLMSGRARSFYLDIKSPGDEGLLTIAVRHSSVRSEVKRDGERVTVHFVIRLTGGVEEYGVDPKAPPTTDSIRAAINETAADRIARLCEVTFNKMMHVRCDAIALGRSVQGTFRTTPEWEAFDWPSKLSNTTATFDVKFSVLSTGFAFQRAFPR
jgi:spore germination protein KC